MGEDDVPGRRVVAGRYALVDVLGRGGMGVVWLADDRLLEREVALKEITYSLDLGEAERRLLRERTLREARAAARLHHPCVTTVFDVVEEGGKPWLVMERVAARSVQDLLDEQGPLAPAAVARIGLDVLAALEAAHRAGIVHRDVKPANVLVEPDGHARLTDFGIATTTGDSSLTGGALIGSPSYMAPERVNGEEPQGPVDLWSLGATLYTAVEGHRPFDRGEAMATLMAVVSEEPEPPKRAGPLEPVLRGLLTKDPARRSTVEQARRGLEAVLAGGPAAAEQPAAPGPRRARATHEAPAVLRAEDLRRLASASRAVLTTVVGEARDSAVAAAQRRRETSSQRRAEVAESRRELRRGVVRRVKHVVIGAVVVALLLVAGLVALVAHLVGAF